MNAIVIAVVTFAIDVSIAKQLYTQSENKPIQKKLIFRPNQVFFKLKK